MMTMAETCPRLAEKLRNLIALNDISQAEVARQASAIDGGDEEITPQAMNRYVKDGASPRPDVARRIAQVLGADPTWFVDETEPWSVNFPRYGAVDLEAVDDILILREVGRRYRSQIIKVVEALDFVESQDLLELAESLFVEGLDLPADAFDRRLDTASSAAQLLDLNRQVFDPESIAWNQHEHLPGAEMHRDDLLFHNLIQRIKKLSDSDLGMLWIDRFVDYRCMWINQPQNRPIYEKKIPKFVQAIKEGKAPDPAEAAVMLDYPDTPDYHPWKARLLKKREDMIAAGFKL